MLTTRSYLNNAHFGWRVYRKTFDILLMGALHRLKNTLGRTLICHGILNSSSIKSPMRCRDWCVSF